MSLRVHIERLIVDEGALSQRDIPRFEQAVSRELDRLRADRLDRPAKPADTLHRLARDTAAAIHLRTPRS